MPIDTAAVTVREVAATVPELWDSPVGTAALAGRLNEHVTALNTIADRWFELAGQARKHADDYSQTVAATPKPQDFKDARTRCNRVAAEDPSRFATGFGSAASSNSGRWPRRRGTPG